MVEGGGRLGATGPTERSSAGLMVQSLESTWLHVPQNKARGL